MKILFVVGPALGHVGRSLVIADALMAKMNIQIHFVNVSPGYGEKLVSHLYPYSNLTYDHQANFALGDVNFADQLESLIEQLSPDLICFDMSATPWLLYIRFPQIQKVYITNFFLTQLSSLTTKQDEWFFSNQDHWNKTRALRGLEPLISARELYQQEHLLLCDPPCLFPSDLQLPSNYHLVGPCSWEINEDLPPDFDELNNVLFLSFGSTGTRVLDRTFVEDVAEVLKITTVIWLGSKLQNIQIEFGRIRHLYFPSLPAAKVLSKSCFVITQGGTGSTYQAMMNGVPIGIWPTHKNHEVLGSIIEEHGNGLLINDLSNTTIDYMQQYTEQMKFQSKEARLSLSTVNGPENAAKVLMNILTK